MNFSFITKKSDNLINSIEVGFHHSLYWPNDDKWYKKAIVTSKDIANPNCLSLLYEDEEVENVDLSDEQFKIVHGGNSHRTQSKKIRPPILEMIAEQPGSVKKGEQILHSPDRDLEFES